MRNQKSGDPKAVASSPQSEAERITVFQIMAREVICLRPDMTVESLRATLIENGISGAPVVDEAGKIVGVVSTTDLVREQYEHGDTLEVTEEVRLQSKAGVRYSPGPGYRLIDPGATVGDVMSRKVLSIQESTPIAEAARLMSRNHIHRLPVVSEAGAVVGLVSSLDILSWLGERPA